MIMASSTSLRVDRMITANSFGFLCIYIMQTQSTPRHYGKLATNLHTAQK
jgi:hypothetical protein